MTYRNEELSTNQNNKFGLRGEARGEGGKGLEVGCMKRWWTRNVRSVSPGIGR